MNKPRTFTLKRHGLYFNADLGHWVTRISDACVIAITEVHNALKRAKTRCLAGDVIEEVELVQGEQIKRKEHKV